MEIAMPNAAGKKCHLSGEQIVVVTEGRYCAECELAFHIDALGSSDTCPGCRRPFEESNAVHEGERERGFLRAEHRVTVTRIWILAAISAFIWLIPIGRSLWNLLNYETAVDISFIKKLNSGLLSIGKAPLVTYFGASLCLYVCAVLWGAIKRPHNWWWPPLATFVFAALAVFYLFAVLNSDAPWWPEG